MEAETVCHPSTEKTEECRPETSRYTKKTLKFMRFSLSMEDTELGGIQEPLSPHPQQNDIEDDHITDDEVFHSLEKMTLNLVVNHDSDADNPLCKCDESMIVADTADIACIFKAQSNKCSFLKSHKGFKYVASKQNKICLEATMSAKITIYRDPTPNITCGMTSSNTGVPVMLNFTGTNNYLCCTQEKILTIKECQLKWDDQSLIFYMSQKFDGLRYFESALHKGWFIHTENDAVVKMDRGNKTSSCCFVLE